MLKKFEYDNIPVVQTTAGYVKGYRYEGTYIFKGIPYAYADRFQMPVPPVSWEGVKDTTSYGMVCPLQLQIYLDQLQKVHKLFKEQLLLPQ